MLATHSAPQTRTRPRIIVADCTIVVPTYNEAENIGLLIPRILENPRFNVLVVDDNTPDGTSDLVRTLAADEPRVILHHRPGKLGFGSAYLAGFRQALASPSEFILQMDADFSHDPRYLDALVQAVEAGADIAIGSRYVSGGGTTDWGLVRRLISRSGNLYAGVILGLPVADVTGGFRCYRREVLESLNFGQIRSNGYAFQIELLYRTLRAGFTVAEVPIIFPDRRVGRSKMSRRIMAEALINVWKLRLGLM